MTTYAPRSWPLPWPETICPVTRPGGTLPRGATMAKSPYLVQAEKPIQTTEDEDFSVLLCPICGNGYLHQISCSAGWRDAEDGPGTVTTTMRNSVESVRVCDKTISGRRDSIDVEFHCENCHFDDSLSRVGSVTLRIQQHKGETWLYWVAK